LSKTGTARPALAIAEPAKVASSPERNIFAAIRAVANAYRKGRPIAREREEMRRDLHRAIDVYMLKKLAGD
jgi:hypothetical protein